MGTRKQLLENCRWLFDQEVNIITFLHDKIWHAIVVPKACSIKSLAQCDINDKILFKVTCSEKNWDISCSVPWNDYAGAYMMTTAGGAIESLYAAIGARIAQVLQAGSDGKFQVDDAAIPVECNIADNIPIPIEPPESCAVSISTQTTSDSEGNDDVERNEEQCGPFKMGTKKIRKRRALKGKKVRIGGQSVKKVAQKPPNDLPSEEYESETSDNNDLPPPEESSSLLILPDATVQYQAASSKTQPLTADPLPAHNKRRSPSDQPIIESYSTQYATSSLEAVFTPGTSVVSDTGSDTTTMPEPEPIDPANSYQQAMRNEIKATMSGFLKSFVEHMEGV